MQVCFFLMVLLDCGENTSELQMLLPCCNKQDSALKVIIFEPQNFKLQKLRSITLQK